MITLLNNSPWDTYSRVTGLRKGKPRKTGGEGEGLLEKPTVDDVFNDSEIFVIPKEKIMQVDVIGSGASATVYKALYNGNAVALKVFHMTVSEMSRTQLAQVEKDVKTIISLSHPNIVTFYGVTWTSPEGQLGVISELVELGSLRQVLPLMHRDMHWSLRLRMALDIAHGMTLSIQEMFFTKT